MKDINIEYEVPEKLVKKMAYKLLEIYAVEKNENLKIFAKSLIKEGIIPADKISADYIHAGSHSKVIHFSCAEILFYNYIENGLTNEKILQLLKLSDKYVQIKTVCKELLKCSYQEDSDKFMMVSGKALVSLGDTIGNMPEKIALFTLYQWAHDIYSPMLLDMFHRINLSYYMNPEDRILVSCKRLKAPFKDNEEVKFLSGKLEKKIEKLSQMSREQMLDHILKNHLHAEYTVNSFFVDEEYFDFVPDKNNDSLIRRLNKAYDDTLFNVIKAAYITVINNAQCNGIDNNKMRVATRMPSALECDFRGNNRLELDYNIIKHAGLESVITDEQYTKSDIQKELMTIDCENFYINVLLAFYKNEMKNTYKGVLKDIFLKELLGESASSDAELSNLKSKIILLMGEKEKFYRENIFLKDKLKQAEKMTSESSFKSLQAEIDTLKRKSGKNIKKIEELEESDVQKSIKIALLEKEIERLKTPPREEKELTLDINKHFLFVCVNKNTCTKLLKWFPNASIFNYNKMVNVKNTDAIIVISNEVKHHEYWSAKNYSIRHNVPFIHCPVKNYEEICRVIAENLSDG